MKISAMKASGITKCSNKKWSGSFSGDPSMSGPSASRSPRPVIQVTEEIHFLVDSNGIDNFPTLVPNEKSIELSKRTYSKKNPIASPRPPFAMHPMTAPSRARSTPVKGNDVDDNLQRKRKWRNDLPEPVLVPNKLSRKNLQSRFKSNGPQSCPPAKTTLRSGSGRSRTSEPSGRPVLSSDSDSDVEIVAVKLYQPVTVQVRKASSSSSSMKKTPTAASQNGKKKSKFFSPQVNHSEILMNEADVAPTDLFSDGGRGSGNSLRWLSANGTIAVPQGEQPPRRDLSPAPKNTIQQQHQPMHLPELKQHQQPEKGQQQENKSKKSRELANLYKNLDEISWTHEKSFKNLLRNPDYIRHSERGAAEKKNLRKKSLTATPKKVKVAAANAVARKKSKMARLNQANKPASTANKARMAKSVVQSSKPTSPVANHPIKKKNGPSKGESLKVAKKEEDDDDNVYYMLNPDVMKGKNSSAPAKGKLSASTTTKAKPLKMTKLDKQPKGGKADSVVPKIKTESSFKSKPKLKPDGPSKSKPDLLNNKPSPDVKKLKSYVPIKESPPSTSGMQRNGCVGGNSPGKSVSGSSQGRPYVGPDALMRDYTNSNYRRFTKEAPMLHGYLDKNEDMFSAFQNASKLRVRLQPLEHTDLWTTEFYEDFRKHFLDQALRKALENRDNDSSNIMYQDMLDSFMNSQGGGGGGGSGGATSRVLKRKQRCGGAVGGAGGEEEGVRSSVRQSEGAFRYKEIVVKKHPNYMQVVLVPNEGKQNSLTVEAMKELKEAFLLAKKDPNCRAVLLNSSGPYFCTGIDLAPLVSSNKRQAAEDISNSVRDLVMTLGMFTKPVVAAVNGAALGFGVSLLTYCDVVLASDKATFCLPATKIGYIPEGGITYTLPQVVGCSVASEMFMQGRRITAEQACRYGLVSEVIWPTRLMNEVIPRLQTIISQPLQAMEATKTMVRCHLWDKLKSHVDRERRLLCEHWLGPSCQSNIKTLLQTGWLLD